MIKIKKPDSIPFTKEALEKIKADFDRLTNEREEVIMRLQTAREMGDLSENGAYKYAKFELGSINRQLRDLKYKLRYGIIMTPSNNGVIGFGSVVELVNGPNKMKFMLVSKHEADPAKNKLSDESPIGKAVLGKKLGDEVSVNTPNGQTLLTITKVN